MTVDELLHAVQAAGGWLTPNGEKLTVEAPAPLSDALIAMLVEHKYEILARLTGTPGAVGRHGYSACPACGDTWQWPTTSGQWVCSWCPAGRRGMPQVAPAGTVDVTSTAPDAIRNITGADGRVWTVAIYRCPQCGGTHWGQKLTGSPVWCCLDCAHTRQEA